MQVQILSLPNPKCGLIGKTAVRIRMVSCGFGLVVQLANTPPLQGRRLRDRTPPSLFTAAAQ